MNNIIKPGIDDSQYEYFILGNELKVYINYDETIISSAVGMCVDVGYNKDEIDGTAHLLEHMLFIGSHKYPKKNYFQEFVSSNNGETNAFTKFNATCYYYTINNESLNDSLDIFAHFFINPLLNPTDILKEKNAVNSEHDKNLNNDMWIYNHLIHTLCIDDINKFGTGNNNTLNNANIGHKVNEFYNKYYSSNIMTLIIITSNNNIRDNVFSLFEQIKNKNVSINNTFDKLFIHNHNTIKIIPYENVDRLIIYWDIHSYYDTQEISPTDYILDLLLRIHKNSLLDILKYKYNYILEYDISISDIFGNRCLCEFNLLLTNNGVNNVNHILFLINSYILFLKKAFDDEKLQQQLLLIYKEMIKINKYKFYYLEFKSSLNKLLHILFLLSSFKFKPELLLCETFYKETLDLSNNLVLNNIKKLINELQLNNACILIASKSHTLNNSLIDKFYNIKYEINKNNLINTFDDKITFELPKINPFLTSNNRITNVQSDKPIELTSLNNICSYLLETNKYKTPNVFILATIELPIIFTQDAKLYSLAILYFNILKTLIHEELQLCELAGYSFNISFLNLYLTLEISGNYKYIVKITELILKIIKKSSLIKKENFDHEKQNLAIIIDNYKYKSPNDKLNNYFNQYISNYYISMDDVHHILSSLTYDDILKLPNSIFEYIDTSLIICGNTDTTQGDIIINLFKNLSLSNNKKNTSLIYVKEPPNKVITIPSNNSNEINNICGNYIELFNINFNNTDIYESIKSMCICNILIPLLNIHYFTILRTEQSFGYIVNVKLISIGHYKFPYYYAKFTIQSSKKTITEINDETNKFIKSTFLDIITNISDEEYKNMCDIQLNDLNEDINSLREYAYFLLLQQINNKINIIEIQKELFTKINKDDIINFYKNKFINNKNFITICIQKSN